LINATRHPSKIDKDGTRHFLIRAIPYKILSKRLSGSTQCKRRGSRSSRESKRTINRRKFWSASARCAVGVSIFKIENGEIKSEHLYSTKFLPKLDLMPPQPTA
jgi:hypothetical protein